MENKKASTLAQRFGFADPELSTPSHDALMVWLDGYMDTFAVEHCPTFTRKATCWDAYYGKAVDFSSFYGGLGTAVEACAAELLGAAPPMRIDTEVKRVWEQPIMNKAFMVGFADMYTYAKWTARNAYVRARYDHSPSRVEDFTFEIRDTWLDDGFWFEVKPSIRSVGEVVRQIRMYQEFTKRGNWFVVSPDDRFASILQAQGIGFLKAPSD